jgi:hypothetical protein
MDNNPANIPNIKYNILISLALEDKNHLSVQSEIPKEFDCKGKLTKA